MGECVKALENVIEDEPHFITKIVDNDLRALTMITKHFATKRLIDSNEGRGGGGLVVLGGKSSRESKNGCVEVGGVEKLSSTRSKFMANMEDCLDGCDGAGSGEVKGGGVDFRVLKSSPGEIPSIVCSMCSMESSFSNEGNWLLQMQKNILF
ncbi:hypothetical protein Tco_0587659 [Tanacetum coccineum]